MSETSVMEEAFRWLASWVSAENEYGNGKGSVRATDFKEPIIRETIRHHDHFESWKMGAAGSFVRLAGVSGAAAIAFGAYGAHGFRDRTDIPRERILAFDTGNRYHLLHSVALLATPLATYPLVTGSLFAVGTTIFSGTCYYYAMTGRDDVRRLTPYGGIILILAWLSLVA